MIKVCARCGIEFEVMNNAKYCEDCRWFAQRDNARRWQAAHRDYYREYGRRWREEHPEQVHEYKRRWYELQKLKLIREILSAVKEAADRD